jgi:hypothetical protein
VARQKMYLPQEKLSMEIFERICQSQEHRETAAW